MVGFEDGVAALAVTLGEVHRDVRLTHQRLGVGIAGHAQADAHAGPHHQRAAIGLEGLGDGCQHAFGDAARDAHVRAVLDEHRELVAAQARGRVAAAQGGADATGDGHQQLVAGVVAQRVVDRLEVVEVHEQHCHALAALGQGMRQAIAEQRPVGEPGERVVQGLSLELVLQLLPLPERAPQLGDHAVETCQHQQEQGDGRAGHHRAR